jgi:hypothetical protein
MPIPKQTRELATELQSAFGEAIRAMEMLRNNLGLLALAAAPPQAEATAPPEKFGNLNEYFQAFLDDACRPGDGLWLRGSDLWRAYKRWCVERQRPRRLTYPELHFLLGNRYEYSRSRRIRGKQLRTYEGIGLSHRRPRKKRP